jgi:hypothetical protein
MAAPANDNFADAQVVGPTLPVAIAATNVDATAEAGEKPHYSSNPPQSSVWFAWTAPAAGKVTVSSCEPDLNFGQVAVYTGTAVNSLTTVKQAGSCIGRFTAVAGTTYRIAVEGNSTRKAFTFNLRQFAPPANDAMATPLTVGPTLPVNQPANNIDSTGEAGEPGGASSYSVWFKWVAPQNAKVRIDVCDFKAVSGPGNLSISVFKAPLVAVDSATLCRLSFDAVAGTDYRIRFDGSFGGEGNFTLKLLKETPPANDAFAASQVIPAALPAAIQGTTVFSTVEANEPHHGNVTGSSSFPANDSVWYSWTPAANADVRVNACADFSARLGVYTGGPALSSLASVTQTPPPTSFPFCALRFQAQAGVTYRIAIGGSGGEREGEFTLDIHAFSPPANDSFAAALQIGPELPLAVPGTNVDAGAEAGEPGHERFDDDQPNASVWYSWTAPADVPVRVSTCGTTVLSHLAVYTGGSLATLAEVGTGKGECGPGIGGNQLEFAAAAGSTYWIAVDGFENREGSFVLSLADLSIPPEVPLVPPAASPAPPARPTPVPATKPPFNLKKALKKCRRIERKGPRKRCVKEAKRRARRSAA